MGYVKRKEREIEKNNHKKCFIIYVTDKVLDAYDGKSTLEKIRNLSNQTIRRQTKSCNTKIIGNTIIINNV